MRGLIYPLASISDVLIISSAWLQSNFPGVYEYDHALDLQAMGSGVVIITDGARPVLVVRPDGSPFGMETYCIENVVDLTGRERELMLMCREEQV